jgi:hypothetical protein
VCYFLQGNAEHRDMWDGREPPSSGSYGMTAVGADIKLVWIAGATRSGSMWTYNVTRELIRGAAFEVLPGRVPITPER